MGYFSPEPKRRKADFFNMEEEWNLLERSLEKDKLTVVTGLRRYGKTSLILTYLNETRRNYVFVDCRAMQGKMLSLRSFMEILEEELSRLSWARDLLSNIEEVRVGAFGVRIRDKRESTLLRVLRSLEGSILVLDEAQELRRSSYRFDSLLAYIYDNLDIKIIVSGSMIGLLYRFLRVDDPEAPLYGRAYSEVRLKPLPKEKAREFLVRGFEQENLRVKEEIIEDAVEKFDGIIGWLTYFGHSFSTGRETSEEILKKASKLAVSELSKALEVYGIGRKRYEAVLKTVATLKRASWVEIKRGIEAKLGGIPDPTLANILKNLVDSGFLVKEDEGYRIADPILEYGVLAYL
jgi:AAA+ ATPase superfamily predicted ATPase